MFTKKQAHTLLSLHKCKPTQRKAMLSSVGNDIIKALSEASYNTLRGNIPLSSAQFRRLKKHKQMMRTMAHKSISLREKRRLLVNQKGGFLPALIPILASTVGGILGNIWGQ